MIIDASAILAILLDEPDAEEFAQRIASAKEAHTISPVNYLEVVVRLSRLRLDDKLADLDTVLRVLRVGVATISAADAALAREAYRRFGKGNHPARLNLGDRFAYALAKARNEALLFKGDDFPRTDIEAVL